jgi:hypothetical protein
MKQLLIISFLIFSFFSCGGTNQDENNPTEVSDTIPSEIEENSDSSQINFNEGDEYENGWIMFKEYVFAKNVDELAFYIPEESEIDAQNVIELCTDNWVWEIMQETEYSDLIDSEYNETAVKEFNAEDIQDIDGVEYGSGIYLYFEEHAVGLRLIGMLAAG